MSRLQLNKDDVLVWKGVAILMIMLHNFSHNLPATLMLESERSFNYDATVKFYQLIINFQDVFFALFSYAGHFGVAVFVFLSGYGLVKKYESNKSNVDSLCDARSVCKYLLYNAIKLWKLFLPLMILYIMFDFLRLYGSDISIIEGAKITLLDNFSGAIKCITFTNALFVEHYFFGTWWYLSLTMQLYVVYLMFHKIRNKLFLIFLALVSVLIQAALLWTGDVKALVFLRWNCVGWLLPFCVGIWASRHGWVPRNLPMLIVYIIAFFILGLNQYLWILQPIFFIFAYSSVAIKTIIVSKVFRFVGVLSPYLFVIHSLPRNIIVAFSHSPYYIGCALFILVSFILATFYKYFLHILYNIKWSVSSDFFRKQ